MAGQSGLIVISKSSAASADGTVTGDVPFLYEQLSSPKIEGETADEYDSRRLAKCQEALYTLYEGMLGKGGAVINLRGRTARLFPFLCLGRGAMWHSGRSCSLRARRGRGGGQWSRWLVFIGVTHPIDRVALAPYKRQSMGGLAGSNLRRMYHRSCSGWRARGE